MSTEPGETPPDRREDDHPPGDHEQGSRRAAVAGLVLVLLLVVIGYFLMTSLRKESNIEDCLMSGRTNCAPLDIPQKQ